MDTFSLEHRDSFWDKKTSETYTAIDSFFYVKKKKT